MTPRRISAYLILCFAGLCAVVACCGPWALFGYAIKEANAAPTYDFEKWGPEGPLDAEKVREGLDLLVRKPNSYNVSIRLGSEDSALVAPLALEKLRELYDRKERDSDKIRPLLGLIDKDVPGQAFPLLLDYARDMRLQGPDLFDGTLATSGRADAIDFLLEKIAKEKDYSWYQIGSGIAAARKAGRLDPSSEEKLKAELARLHQVTDIKVAESVVDNGATDVWLQLDPKAAADRITLPPFWATDFPSLGSLIHELANNRVIVPADRLRELGRAIWEKPRDEMPGSLFPQIVFLSAVQKAPGTDRLIAELEKIEDPWIKSQALTARAALVDIFEPEETLSKIIEEAKDNPESLSQELRDISRVQELVYNIDYEGLSYYFSSELSDKWQEDVEALRRLGFSKASEEIEAGAALFGSEKPAATAKLRDAQIALLHQKDRDRLESLGEELSGIDATAMVYAYAMKHPEQFRSPR